MLSEAEREGGGEVRQDTSPAPPGEGYATCSMRSSAHSSLALWVSQLCALCTGKRVNSMKADYSPGTWGLMIRNTEHSVLGSSILNAQNRPIISVSCVAA